MKIVINSCFGGFSLSIKAEILYCERKGMNAKETDDFYSRELERDDPLLIEIVEELGEKANGRHAELDIIEIPDGVGWVVEEYDGLEHIAEKHRTWR